MCSVKDVYSKPGNGKNRLRAANPRLVRGKLLYYGTIGLMMGNIYLTCKINVILAMGNIIVVLRRKPDAKTVLANVNLRDFIAV